MEYKFGSEVVKGWDSNTISIEDKIKYRLEIVNKQIEKLKQEKRLLEQGIYTELEVKFE